MEGVSVGKEGAAGGALARTIKGTRRGKIVAAPLETEGVVELGSAGASVVDTLLEAEWAVGNVADEAAGVSMGAEGTLTVDAPLETGGAV